MPKGPQGQKRPADAIGRAIMVAKIATGEVEETTAAPSSSTAKTEAARKGGITRTKVVSPKRRTEIARNAANARWKGAKAPTD
jgi:hypothetical protein